MSRAQADIEAARPDVPGATSIYGARLAVDVVGPPNLQRALLEGRTARLFCLGAAVGAVSDAVGDRERLRAALVRLGGLVLAWVEAIDAREAVVASVDEEAA